MPRSYLTLAKTQSDETPFQGVVVRGESPAGGSGAGSETPTSTEEAKVPCARGVWEAGGSCQQSIEAVEGGTGEGLQSSNCQVARRQGCEER